MKIYRLQTYEYDTYSYSGITESEEFFFTTYKAAEDKAKKLKLNLVEYPEYYTDCVIDEIDVEELK